MNKKGKLLLLLIIFVIVAVVLLIRDILKPMEIEPEYVFFYAENQTEDYPTTLGGKRFAELVEERTDGRIRIMVQAEGKMGTERDVLQQLQYGGIDFARVSLSQLAELVPQMNVLQMPYIYENSEHMWQVLEGEIGDSLLADVNSIEMVGLSWYDAGARNFYSTEKPITCLEDIQGMRIRVQESEVMADMIETLGATALPITYAEVYSSLERGVCDGAENNWPSYEAMRHYEVAKYYSVDEHTRVPEIQLCSIHTWEKLSSEDQRIIKECAEESALYQREVWAQREEASRQTALENGVMEVVLSSEEKQRFRQEMSEIYEKYCSDYMDIIEQIIAAGEMR